MNPVHLGPLTTRTLKTNFWVVESHSVCGNLLEQQLETIIASRWRWRGIFQKKGVNRSQVGGCWDISWTSQQDMLGEKFGLSLIVFFTHIYNFTIQHYLMHLHFLYLLLITKTIWIFNTFLQNMHTSPEILIHPLSNTPKMLCSTNNQQMLISE